MQIIIKENITNLKRGGPIQCDMKCLSSSLCKKFRKWAGPFPPKIQNFNLGYGFHTKYTCSHGRILRIKWFIGEKGEIHSAKNEWVENKKKQELNLKHILLVKKPINDENFRDPMEYVEKIKDDSEGYEQKPKVTFVCESLDRPAAGSHVQGPIGKMHVEHNTGDIKLG